MSYRINTEPMESNLDELNGNNVDPSVTCKRPVTVAATSVKENRHLRRPRSRSNNTTAASSPPFRHHHGHDPAIMRGPSPRPPPTYSRPHTATMSPSRLHTIKPAIQPRNSADLDDAAEAIQEASALKLGQQRTEILEKRVCGRYNNLPGVSENDNRTAIERDELSADHAGQGNSRACDLEFVNKKYSYDQVRSVPAFDKEQLESSLLDSEEPGRDNGSNNEVNDDGRSVLTSTSSALQRIIEMGQNMFDSSIANVDLLSGAAKVGEKIYKTGVGVASALFREQDGIRSDKITYNGFKIHTFGTHLCINSVILRGPKNQRMRIVVQTKDYEGLTSTQVQHKFKAEPKIYVVEDKWTLVYGSYEEEDAGLVEIQVPWGVSLKDIKTEGPCKGLIFIDIL